MPDTRHRSTSRQHRLHQSIQSSGPSSLVPRAPARRAQQSISRLAPGWVVSGKLFPPTTHLSLHRPFPKAPPRPRASRAATRHELCDELTFTVRRGRPGHARDCVLGVETTTHVKRKSRGDTSAGVLRNVCTRMNAREYHVYFSLSPSLSLSLSLFFYG